MPARRFGPPIVFLVLLVCGGLACSIPGFQLPSPEEQTPVYSPTYGATTPTPAVYPTETVLEPTPPSEVAADQGLTWFASEVTGVGEPYDGWQDYWVVLACENSTGQFINGSFGLGELEVVTDQGDAYRTGVNISSPYGRPWASCSPGPPSLNPQAPSTGVIPPGFRVRGAILYDYITQQPCVFKNDVGFTLGETLHPRLLTFRPTELIPTVPDRAIALDEVDETLVYGPVDPSARFDSLPAVVNMGKLRVTIEDASRSRDGKIVFYLRYENTDPGQEAFPFSPIVSVIDSDGYLSAPGAYASMGTNVMPLIPTDQGVNEYCPDFPSGSHRIGPLQELEQQVCVSSNPSPPRDGRYFVVACGWGEDLADSRTRDQIFQFGLMGVNPDYPKECHIYEVDIPQ